MPKLNLSNVFLIKFLSIVRVILWYSAFLLCAVTRTLFIMQTWSNKLIIILIINLLATLTNLLFYIHRHFYRKIRYLLIIGFPLLTISTFIIYLIYMWNIHYRIMNLVTINIMTNDRSQSHLSTTLIHYQCCRIQEEILYDSVNERDYFLRFPFCQNAIVENEMRKDLWDNITTCSLLFQSIIFYIRIAFVFDLFMNISLLILWLFHLDEDQHSEWTDQNSSSISLPFHSNQKIK